MSAKSAIQDVKDGLMEGTRLERLKVSPEMMEELVRECAPQTPSEYFGFPIEVLESAGATVH